MEPSIGSHRPESTDERFMAVATAASNPHSSHLNSRSTDDDTSAEYDGSPTEITEMPLLVDVHGMSDAHGVDVALGLPRWRLLLGHPGALQLR